jgi:hypothetical protein
MLAYDLALQNFAIAEHLLQLHQLFRDLRSYEPKKALTLAVCEEMSVPASTALHHAKNEHLACSVKAAVPLPSCLLANDGLNFLLRQSVLVSCTALESYFWDVLRENALTVIRAKGRKADSTLKEITLTLDDYLSLEGYGDPDERLSQIILKRFERGTLYDLSKIDEIAGILTIKDFWGPMSTQIGLSQSELKGRLGSLIQRRNDITHRADRPDKKTPPDDIDSHGLRAMSHAWATTHVMTAKSVVTASADIFKKALGQLQLILAAREEQKLASKTIRSTSDLDIDIRNKAVESAPAPAPKST